MRRYKNYGGGPISDDFMIVAVKPDARTRDEKDAAIESIVEHLLKSAGVRPEDVLIIFDPGQRHHKNDVFRAITEHLGPINFCLTVYTMIASSLFSNYYG